MSKSLSKSSFTLGVEPSWTVSNPCLRGRDAAPGLDRVTITGPDLELKVSEHRTSNTDSQFLTCLIMVGTNVVGNIDTERVRGGSPQPADGIGGDPSLVHISARAIP